MGFDWLRKLCGRKPQLYVVRLYDGFDNRWIDVTDPISQKAAFAIWLEKTEGGTKKIEFSDIDYYRVFPADTKMLYSDD